MKQVRRTWVVAWVFAISLTVAGGQSRIAYLPTRIPNESVTRELPMPHGLSAIPFELIDKVLLVEGQLNGQTGYFILDTGAPTLVINSKTPGSHPSLVGKGLTNTIEVGDTLVQSFQLNQESWKNIPALSLNLQHLEQFTRRRILGLIGYELLKDFELVFSPREKRLFLLPPGNNQLHKVGKPQVTLPLEWIGHLPVITMRIGNQTIKVGLDTGAGSSLISNTVVDALHPTSWLQVGDAYVQGLNRQRLDGRKISLNQATLGKLNLPDLPFIATQLDHLNQQSEINMQALLGIDILGQMMFSIDFKSQKIHIWYVLDTE